jgi:hypothetical protein
LLSSQQKERLSPHGDRRAPLRKSGRIVAVARAASVRKACQTIPYNVDISRPQRRYFAPGLRGARSQQPARKRLARRCLASAPSVAWAHQSSVSPGTAALLWCESLARAHAEGGYRANY